eukprot:UN12290
MSGLIVNFTALIIFPVERFFECAVCIQLTVCLAVVSCIMFVTIIYASLIKREFRHMVWEFECSITDVNLNWNSNWYRTTLNTYR